MYEARLVGLPSQVPRSEHQNEHDNRLQGNGGNGSHNGHGADACQKDHSKKKLQNAPGGLVGDDAVTDRKCERVETEPADEVDVRALEQPTSGEER